MHPLLRLLLALAATPLLLGAGGQRSGPPDHSAAAHTRMRAVDFLVGTWEGTGWMRMGPGEPERFRSHERVERRLDGLALIIEGRHESLTDGREGEVVHHALAMLTWNPNADAFDFRSMTNRGLGGNYAGEVEDGAFVWRMEAPDNRRIRYTIRLDDEGRWTETGERSPPGSDAWHEFFGMTLRRVE